MNKNSKIYVAGSTGLVGSAIVRKLISEGYTRVITERVDLTDWISVCNFFTDCLPEYVFLAAAKVGGILANSTYPADFITDNLMIQTNVIRASHKYGVSKLLFLGSSCIYPRDCPQPMKEEYLLTGPLEETNYAYAVAKIAGIKMCKAYNTQYGTNYISCMPTNVYGPNDNFNVETSHVLAGLISKISFVKHAHYPSFVMWGTGKPLREFIYVDDLADACIFLMQNYNYNSEIVNIGTGEEVSIQDLASKISKVIGYSGRIVNDLTKPDGTPRKLLDVSKITKLGWTYSTNLEEGIRRTYEWYKKNILHIDGDAVYSFIPKSKPM